MYNLYLHLLLRQIKTENSATNAGRNTIQHKWLCVEYVDIFSIIHPLWRSWRFVLSRQCCTSAWVIIKLFIVISFVERQTTLDSRARDRKGEGEKERKRESKTNKSDTLSKIITLNPYNSGLRATSYISQLVTKTKWCEPNIHIAHHWCTIFCLPKNGKRWEKNNKLHYIELPIWCAWCNFFHHHHHHRLPLKLFSIFASVFFSSPGTRFMYSLHVNGLEWAKVLYIFLNAKVPLIMFKGKPLRQLPCFAVRAPLRCIRFSFHIQFHFHTRTLHTQPISAAKRS